MPTYDYVCTLCDHEMEAFHSMSAPPLQDCPACGKPGLKRKIGTGAGLIFKGAGFYTTDYRSDSYKNAAKAETGGKSAKESAPASSTAAPAAKADSPKPAASV